MLKPKLARWGTICVVAATFAACDDGTGVSGPEAVSLSFRVQGLGVPAAVAAAGGPSLVAGPPMTLDGTNGSLRLDEIRLVINEVELKRDDDGCEDVPGVDDDDCDEFEAPPRFLDLPLDGEPIVAVTAMIPPGEYKELDFEIEDLEDDEENAAERAAIDAVRAEVLSAVPDWPREASALVVGSFTPSGGSAIDFRVFLDAEIEIEMELLPRLVVGENGSPSRDLTVDVRPDIWFMRSDGSVLPLHLYDYGQTGQLLEFEVEMEEGFTEIEIG